MFIIASTLALCVEEVVICTVTDPTVGASVDVVVFDSVEVVVVADVILRLVIVVTLKKMGKMFWRQ
jgi:hypothetical protein